MSWNMCGELGSALMRTLGFSSFLDGLWKMVYLCLHVVLHLTGLQGLCLPCFKTEERARSQQQRHQWFNDGGAYTSEARSWSDNPPCAADGRQDMAAVFTPSVIFAVDLLNDHASYPAPFQGPSFLICYMVVEAQPSELHDDQM